MKKSKTNFESSIQRLEDIVSKLESGEETLENSLELYEEGMQISKYCKEMLDNAVQRITMIENDK